MHIPYSIHGKLVPQRGAHMIDNIDDNVYLNFLYLSTLTIVLIACKSLNNVFCISKWQLNLRLNLHSLLKEAISYKCQTAEPDANASVEHHLKIRFFDVSLYLQAFCTLIEYLSMRIRYAIESDVSR